MAAVPQTLQTEMSTKSPRLRPESDTSQPRREDGSRASEEKEPGNSEWFATHGSSGPRMGDASRTSKEGALPIDVQNNIHQEEEDIHTKEAAEVAAAARFISQVDNGATEAEMPPHNIQKPRLSGTTSVRDSILESAFNMSKSRTSKPLPQLGQKRNKTSRPAPLQLDEVLSRSFAEESKSPIPQRSSSKGAPSFDLARSSEPERSSLERTQDADNKDMQPRMPESTTPFQFDFPASTEPRLSGSVSAGSTASQSPPTPPAVPSDGQTHQTIETLSLGQGPDSAESRRVAGSLELNLTGEREARQPPLLPPKDIIPTTRLAHAKSVRDTAVGKEGTNTAAPALRRKRSIFGWLQKRPEVDVEDLIDLYLTDEQLEEVKTVKQKPSKQRLAIFRSRNVTDPLPLNGG